MTSLGPLLRCNDVSLTQNKTSKLGAVCLHSVSLAQRASLVPPVSCQRSVHPTNTSSNINQQRAIRGGPMSASMPLAPDAGHVLLMGSWFTLFLLCIGFLHHKSG